MVKINMGCGKRNFGKDWIHVDGDRSYEHVDTSDIYLSFIENEKVDLIYASHFIEYFDRKEVLVLLNAWYNKLKPGGVLRLSVPNFPQLVKVYRETQDINTILGPLFGHMEMGGKSIYHKTVYDYVSLRELLMSIGFKDIQFWNWRNVEHGEIDDHSQAYYPHMQKETGLQISLNLECKK